MRPPGKSALTAFVLVFAPGIAFALFELFVARVPVRGKALVAAWASLAVGVLCVAGLLALTARDAVRKRKARLHGS